MTKKKTLILIDGHALAFRQYYALERTFMSTSSGTPSWAVFGFFKAIFDLLKTKKISTDAIAVAFDVSHNTFRVEKYKEYKSNRMAMPEAMREQLRLIKEGLKAFSIPIYTKEGFEADDVIGTISKRACELGHNVLILTGDHDAFQLIDKEGRVKVIIPSRGELVTYDWDKVYEKMGVYPDQIVDYKALRGDISDNIPGIYGIGEKTAALLLSQFGHLENVLAKTSEITKPALRKRIEEGVEIAKLSKVLATIVQNVDIDFDFDKACIQIPDLSAVTDFLKKMEFYKFLKNINNLMTIFNSGIPCSEEDIIKHSAVEKTQLQLNFFTEQTETKTNDIELVQTQEQLEAAVKDLEKQSLISIHAEALVKNITNSHLYGIALGYTNTLKFADDKILVCEQDKEQAKIYYIPVAHTNLDKQLSLESVIQHLKPILENPAIKKTTHNAKAQYGILRDIGIYTEGFVIDILLASYEKNASKKHELIYQALENIGHTMADYTDYHGKKREQVVFSEVDIDRAKTYTGDIAETILELTKFWVKNLSEAEWKLLKEIDLPVSFVLADMEFTGAAVDLELLEKYAHTLTKNMFNVERKIYHIAGEVFNLNSPKQIADIIYDKLKLIERRKRTTGADILEDLAKDHKICKLILDYRKQHKLKTVYVDGITELIEPSDSRVHTTYNLTATVTGRLSSSNPNLQSIPVRTEQGSKIRKAFIPGDRKNYLIMSADYSQIELRLLAHISNDKNLIEAFKQGIDIHTMTASKVFELPMGEITKEMRYKAKAVNFGIIYGQSKYGLAKALGIKTEEAECFIKRYLSTYPNVKKYMDKIVEKTKKIGYCETLFGRRRYLTNEFESSFTPIKEFAKRAAINFPIQGTGADLIKKAMLVCHKRFNEENLKSKMILQVHDEIVVEVYKEELDIAKAIVKEAMECGQPFKVPLVVDIYAGETWKE